MVGVPYPALEAMLGEKVNREHEGLDEQLERYMREKAQQQDSDRFSDQDGVEKELEEKRQNGELGRPWHVESKSGLKEGRSFHHGRLISSLRRKVLNDSTATVLEATVRDLIYCEHTDRVIGVSAAFKIPSTSTEEEEGVETVVKNIYAPLTIIADGCFSKFRNTKGARLPKPKTRSHFVGVIVKDAALPLPHHGTVCLTPSGPVLLYQIGLEARETRMLVDVKGKLPSVADGSLKVGLAFIFTSHS